MNSAGAVAAILVGALIAGAYLIGAHIWPVEFVDLFGTYSDAGEEAVARFTDLNAAFGAASDPQAQAIAWTALRDHAATMANIGGLKPAAIVLVAVPAALLVGIGVSLLFRERRSLQA